MFANQVRGLLVHCLKEASRTSSVAYRSLGALSALKTPNLTAYPQQLLLMVSPRDYSVKKSKGKGGNIAKPKVELNEDELNQVVDFNQLKHEMRQAVDYLKKEYNESLNLRLTPDVVEQINVRTTKGIVKLGELAPVEIKSANMLTIDMIENPDMTKLVMESIAKANLNLNPQLDKTSINLPLPKVTREHRENLTKAIKTKCENALKKLRDIEGKALRKAKENKKVSKDLAFNASEHIKYQFEIFSKEAANLKEAKTKEILQE